MSVPALRWCSSDLEHIPFTGNHLVQHGIDEESDEQAGDETCHDAYGERPLSIRSDLAVQFLSFGFNSFQDVLRLFPAQHENDALNYIVILLEAEFTEAWRVPDCDIANITHSNGHAFIGDF
jgi:hypothetical protein